MAFLPNISYHLTYRPIGYESEKENKPYLIFGYRECITKLLDIRVINIRIDYILRSCILFNGNYGTTALVDQFHKISKLIIALLILKRMSKGHTSVKFFFPYFSKGPERSVLFVVFRGIEEYMIQ